ncbi:hypothetical protein HYT84_01980 [Candidatus Micrarchaeota archaeon]|nr:hypothetical protein [Candidatus Micrarchaeota archaeon]
MEHISNRKIAVLALILFLAIMLFSGLYYFPKLKDQSSFYYKEEPIHKTSKFILTPGEVYIYSYKFKNSETPQFNVTYTIRKNFGCIVFEIKEFKSVSDCIDQNGNDKNGSNLTLNNGLVEIFKPWMLAVDENWVWKIDLVSNVITNYKINSYEFSVAGTEDFNGREAYKVKILKNGNLISYLLVDKEKRILLKEEQDAYVVELVYPGPSSNLNQ